MGFKKFILLIFSLLLIASMTWLVLMYLTYGKQTMLFLIRSNPELFWTYSKAVFMAPSPSPDSADNNGLLNTNVLERPRASLPPIDAKHYIAKMSHSYQKLNNCGPVTASMVASTYGIIFDQFYAADQLKGGPTDKNVGPREMVRFLESQGLKVAYRLNGNPDIMEQFISRDIPVIVEQWLLKRENGELVGHYRALRGYDRDKKLFTTNDSFNGPNFVIPYSQFDEWWRPFNRTYLVVYKPEQENTVKQILELDWDKNVNAEGAAKAARSEIATVGDGYSYFNLGTAYTVMRDYAQASAAYDNALTKEFPPLFLWYEFGYLEAYYRTGRYDDIFRLTDKVLSSAGEVEEAHYYRGLAYTKQGKLVEARIEQEKTLAANPRFFPPFE